MTEEAIDHAPHCARSPINVMHVVINAKPYVLRRCGPCGAQTLTRCERPT